MYPLINATAINAPDSDGAGAGVGNFRPLAFGKWVAVADDSIRNVDLYLPGLNLVRTDWHSMEAAQPKPHVTMEVGSARPLSFGEWAAAPGSVALQANDAYAMAMGTVTAERIGFATGSSAMVPGDTAAVRVGFAGSSHPFAMGSVSAVASFAVPGLALARAGRASITLHGSEVHADGSYALQCGATGIAHIAYARQSVALRMGTSRLVKDGAC